MHLVFETPRLWLRRFTLADTDLLLRLNSDPEVLKYLHEPLLHDEEHAQQILRDNILPQYFKNLGRWAVFTRGDNQFIGWCGLKHRQDLNEIDLGYRFLPIAWGKGYATEASQETLHHGFHQLSLPLITGRAHIHNIASIKVLQKIGMQYKGEGIVDNCPVHTYTAVNPFN
ncbi:MAG: anhydro-N-acetylmuramic acid kinase [Ferruginibacter sp.]|nr:anhydro-N-acetylmuramic acid kinase [Ferruginibacter sp.]